MARLNVGNTDLTSMKTRPPYLSIRWKIILLAGLVLGLTSALFIWQQHKLRLYERALNQAEFREHSHIILDHLFQSQAYRMQMLGNLLVAQANVRKDVMDKRGDRLALTVQTIAPELNFAQSVITVVFHDANEQALAIWGDPLYADDLIPLAGLYDNHEKSKTHFICKQACVQQLVVPINYRGRRIGSIALISTLERIQSDLHLLNKSDVAVLDGKSQDERAPIAGMRIVSVSGGAAISDVLDAARTGVWQNGMFQLEHAGQIHQVLLIPTLQTGDSSLRFALIQNVTSDLQQIDSNAKQKLWWGLMVLFFALLLLFAMLRPTMRRFSHLSQILPLLGQENFAQVREAYANRPIDHVLGGIWQDEVDELEKLALALADRLEQLRDESLRQVDTLNLQTSNLKHERDFISSLLDIAPVLILSYAADGRIRLCNAHAMKISGLTNVTGKNFAELFLGISQQKYSKEMAEIRAGVIRRMESAMRHPDGSSFDVLWFHSSFTAEGADAPTYLSVGMDITEHKKNEARIHNLAFYDLLTKLPNRRMLVDNIRHAMSTSAQDKTHCAIIFIDLDNFNSVNGSKGRHVGDQLLIEMAKRLRGSLREFDTVAHLGVDEFVVLLEELSEDLEHAAVQTRLIAEKLRTVISQPCLLQDYNYHFTCSVGVTLFTGHGITVDSLLRQANIAMTHAKTSGRDCLQFFDPEMQRILEVRTSLEADLRSALAKNQFRLFYQVQMNQDGLPVGAEALLRWLHPEQGMVSPAQFIPFIEESELMLPLGRWLLETACAQLKSWETDSLTCELKLAVNVSARQFHEEDFVAQVQHTLKQSGASPGRLKLELTESIVLEDIADAIAKMLELKKIGVQISIDDFGTAYSSLSYLTQLPLDQLKIDQSFVRNIGLKSSDDIVIQTIINMARDLGMDVIAEGVETPAQLQFLKAAGCCAFQGYLFSKPLALQDFSVYLSNSASRNDSRKEGE